MRNKLTEQERETRNAARWKIIQTANQFLMGFHANHLYVPALLGMKNLHRAVYICRQNMLVRGKVFIEAGFNPPVLKPTAEPPMIFRKLMGK
jgi:hypothetical protein